MTEQAGKSLFQQVIEHSTDAVVLMDDAGLITYFNRAAEQLFRYDREQVLGRPLTMLMPEALREKHRKALARHHSSKRNTVPGNPRRFQGLRSDGEMFQAEITLSQHTDNGRLYFAGTIRNISQQLRAQRALMRSEQNFRTLIEKMPEAVAVHRNGRFLYVNSTMVHLLGYDSQEELVGEPVLDIVHPDERQIVRKRISTMMLSGEPPPPLEERFICRDGTVVHAEVVAMTIEYEGHPCILAIGRDLTERKQITARMMQADRMIAMGMLAAGVAHEINNPLTYVSANIHFALESLAAMRPFLDSLGADLRQRLGDGAAHELLASSGFRAALDSVDDSSDVLGEAREGSRRIRDIVRDLKTFSRADDTRQESLSVRELIESTINMAFNEIRHRARLVKDYSQDPRVLGNSSRLGQLFLNLLVNAAHSIPAGDAAHNEIRVVLYVHENEVVVEIRDTGKGIQPRHMPRLFEPFFTTKPMGQGTGLGLYVCHRVVKAHGGTIEIESELGQGSVFRVKLPLAPESPPTEEPFSSETTPSPSRARLLIVDDEPMILRGLQRLFRDEHEVALSKTAREVLGKIREGQRFDLILCDLMMPEMSGIQLYEKLRDLAPGQAERMVFMTGGAFTPRAREFLDRVSNPQVEKPFDPLKLRAMVKDWMG